MRQDLCDWFEQSGATVQGSALSPGVFGPRRIHHPSKRRCPKDLYKFACRIPRRFSRRRCRGRPVASVDARFTLLETSILPNIVLTITRSGRFSCTKLETDPGPGLVSSSSRVHWFDASEKYREQWNFRYLTGNCKFGMMWRGEKRKDWIKGFLCRKIRVIDK